MSARDYRYVCDQILQLICDQSDCDEWRKVWRAEGYKQGHAEGLMEGKESGNATGFITGIEVGNGQGMLDGLHRGNETGFQIGAQLGYDEGYWRAISHFMMLLLIFGKYSISISKKKTSETECKTRVKILL